MIRCFGSMALAGFLLVAGGPARAADDLEKELLGRAPAVLRYLRDKSCKNVGVLKFRVKKGNEPVSDGVGPINLNLASRFEVALVLANDNDPAKQVGIIRSASTVAAGLEGASHLSREGRQALFNARYPLAWGKQRVVPDAFLTGVVQLTSDLSEMTVGIVACRKDAENLEKVVQFTVATDANSLFEAGESFLLRGGFDGGNVVTPKLVAKKAESVKTRDETHPLTEPAAPIALEVFYDDARIPVEVREGHAWVREPQEGQKVHFVLRRNQDSKARYAVVLMVNGENTLYRQRLPAHLCRKWVLDPGDEPTVIRGYRVGDKGEGEAFRVLSRAESKRNQIYYGADVGKISFAVFREKKGPPPAPQLTDEEEDLAVLTRGLLPNKPSENLAALKAQLRENLSRNLIVPGERINVETRQVKFVADPTPVLSATITYYKPQ